MQTILLDNDSSRMFALGLRATLAGSKQEVVLTTIRMGPLHCFGGGEGNGLPGHLGPSKGNWGDRIGRVVLPAVVPYFAPAFALICARSSFVRFCASATCWGDMRFSRLSRAFAASESVFEARLYHA